MRDCKHKDECSVCKKCSACHIKPFNINEDCKTCLSCERIGELSINALAILKTKPTIIRPHFIM